MKKVRTHVTTACHNRQQQLSTLGSTTMAIAMALALQPDYPEALFNLALILFNRGEYQEAEEHITGDLRLRPNHVEEHHLAGLLR